MKITSFLIRLFNEQGFWHSGFYMVSGFIPGMEADLLTALPADRIEMLHRGNAEQWRLWLLRYTEQIKNSEQKQETRVRKK